MKNIFFLDSILSTKIVTLIYWVILLTIWIVGFAFIFGFGGGEDQNLYRFMHPVLSIFWGLCILFFGSIFARLWAEFMVVIFKIQQNTRRTADLLEKLEKNK